jgi:hypothetical protein
MRVSKIPEVIPVRWQGRGHGGNNDFGGFVRASLPRLLQTNDWRTDHGDLAEWRLISLAAGLIMFDKAGG